MEKFRTNSIVKLLKGIKIWTYLGRILPILYVPVSLVFFFFYQDRISILTSLVVIFSSLVAISWWWWAMDVMKWLTRLYSDSIEKQQKILDELKELRLELNASKPSK